VVGLCVGDREKLGLEVPLEDRVRLREVHCVAVAQADEEGEGEVEVVGQREWVRVGVMVPVEVRLGEGLGVRLPEAV
jgi:hypothetical protein